ncbi:MAG: hypothetical protein KGK07_07395 [Chloroflexota bacterium]|nr:hypothetical protein [Chloroflexota bacterium]
MNRNAARGAVDKSPAPNDSGSGRERSSRPVPAALAARQPTWAAAPLPGGGWRITVPGRPVSSNQSGGGHEHWAARSSRKAGYLHALTLLRLSNGLPRPVFERATLAIACYFPTRRERDPRNFDIGAGAKVLVDALLCRPEPTPMQLFALRRKPPTPGSGWLRNDDPEHLRVPGEPSIEVGALRTEIVLGPWEGEA